MKYFTIAEFCKSEASLLGTELPYDIAELHAQRQAERDEINQLENML